MLFDQLKSFVVFRVIKSRDQSPEKRSSKKKKRRSRSRSRTPVSIPPPKTPSLSPPLSPARCPSPSPTPMLLGRGERRGWSPQPVMKAASTSSSEPPSPVREVRNDLVNKGVSHSKSSVISETVGTMIVSNNLPASRCSLTSLCLSCTVWHFAFALHSASLSLRVSVCLAAVALAP